QRGVTRDRVRTRDDDRGVVIQVRNRFLDGEEHTLDVDSEGLIVARFHDIANRGKLGIGANLAMPALANNTSMRPSLFATTSNSVSRSPSLLTSERTATVPVLSPLTASSSDFWSRPEIATLAPASRNN